MKNSDVNVNEEMKCPEYQKKNGNVAFTEGNHKYFDITDPSKEYISVTTLIHRYTQEFDKDFWSAYKALEKLIPKESWNIEKKSLLNTKKFNKEILDVYNISENDFNKTQQEILDAWDEENRKSCERGTKIHADIENSFYDNPHNISLKKFGLGGKFECKKDYSELDLEYGVYPEYLVYRESDDGILRLAGQVDLIIKSGNEIVIVDHKGLPLDTPIATEDGFKLMKDLNIGDKVFDKDGKLCSVTAKSGIHHNPCYKITFDNSESIIADHEHRWFISFSTSKNSKYHGEYIHKVMTTEELSWYLDSIKDHKISTNIPKILNVSPIDMEYKELPIDPYVLGCWLGDGSKSCGVITQSKDSKLWEEITNRGYSLGDNLIHDENRKGTESRTVFGLITKLKELNLINNKHIPDLYLRASYSQRLDLLRGLMDTDGYYHIKRHRYIMNTDSEWQARDLVKLLGTLGIKPTLFNATNKCNGKEFKGWNVCFNSMTISPFLIRNQTIQKPKMDKCSFRIIKSVEACETVETQCIAVDSPSHTYCFGYTMIPTHNTNKKIDLKAGYNTQTKSSAKMKFPLNNLDDANFYHYTLQLSTYAWMLQKINPNFIIKDLILNHYDHNGNNTLYHCDYLKADVERMLRHYKKELILENQRSKRKRIEY